jgi:uncharacterized SAM-binding protein YcdF (DUF218 family)
MLVLKKIVTSIGLPPGIFIILLIGSGLWLFNQKQRKAGAINFIIAGLIWGLSISPVSNTMLKWLESDFYFSKSSHGDVIILLGERVDLSAPGVYGIGSPSEMMLARIIAAANLQSRTNIPLIISHGQEEKTEVIKAAIIKRYLVELGVPSDLIILEEQSRNTFENASYSHKICIEKGFKNPILVTSAYHLKRSVLSFEKVGMNVIPVPSNFLSWKNREFGWDSVLPGHESLRHSSIAAKEFIGLIFYKLFY